jgi:hypothetical protein
MHKHLSRASLWGTAALVLIPALAMGQMAEMDAMDMAQVRFGSGWTVTGMAQLFPVVTFGAPGDDDNPLNRTEAYLTQPAVMANLESPGQRISLRTTLNFEGITQEDGELTFGGWGEGFIDKRHPHTLVHELMLSVNLWSVAAGDLSISAGKGFAPYGTSDPMARPGLKYPTNHHLSQILERWTANVAWLGAGGWSVEAGIFGGQEPDGAYDFSNIEAFGDSWSARVARRWRGGPGPASEWEASASFGSVTEFAHTVEETSRLINAALTRSGPLGPGSLYALVEASASFLEGHDDFFSFLAEARYDHRGHQPYVRFEYARRPEYEREGPAGEDDFFLYEHHDDPVGSTRWLISTAAYAYEVTGSPWSVRPFVEVQYHQARGDRGAISATDLYGSTSFWGVSVGARVFLGGDPMRMGSYGVLDPMTQMNRGMNDMPMGG